MIDLRLTKMTAYRANIDRYSKLLATPLTDVERAYVQGRLTEERAALEQLEARPDDDQNVVALVLA